MDVYNRYAPYIQDFIYRSGWESLRAVQVAAGDAIFNTDSHVLLAASTASGKTEAAFFPILTLFDENPPASVGALYIGPLKALINDQFRRLDDLCREGGVPVWHWHGDVSRTHKEKLLKNPSGILQITPESLEALLLHRHAFLPRLFGDLRFVVIDEVHALLRGDRGGQTLCLIERLSRAAGVEPRRIGLSATVGDPESTGALLARGTGRQTVIPQIAPVSMKWRLSMEHFTVSGGPMPGERLPGGRDETADDRDPGYAYIYRNTRDRKCLVFVNSREECEAVTTTLRQYCEYDGERDRFLIHHGNLSASYRETAEEAMKDDAERRTTVTTATLELGIDIGRLERAFQVEAPYTVSSFLQRMGRTGRRGAPPEMWFVLREEQAEPRALLPETVPWSLLQAAALVQLYIEERWVEPPRLTKLPYSLLYHQTMSTLASGGEMTPAALASRVLTLPVLQGISPDDYRILLRHLVEQNHIQRTERGGLIVGLSGERVVNSYKFYAVFQESEEYTVRAGAQELGTVCMPPPAGEKIALAGAVWTVLEVDRAKHLIYCEPVKGKVPACFGMCPGDIHTHILERMRTVLAEDVLYPYLLPHARKRLQEARSAARNAGMTQKPLIHLGGQMWCLFPWLGTYAFLALERFLKLRLRDALGLQSVNASRPYFIQFTMKASEAEFYAALAEAIAQPPDPMELVYPGEVPEFEKYDRYVPDVLLQKGFAYGVLDVEGMRTRVLEWCGGP